LVKSSLLGYGTIDETVFSKRSAPNNSRITGLCNPFLCNGCVSTFPRIGPCYENCDIINNRDGVFLGVCVEYLPEKGVTEFVQGQLPVSRKLEE
jgi:hypothetical protein